MSSFAVLPRAVAIVHEAVELFLVARPAEVLHERLELATLVLELPALFLEPLQLALAVLVEGDVAAPREAARDPQPRQSPRNSARKSCFMPSK